MKIETNVPEYFKADIPFNPDVDINRLKDNIEHHIKKWYPLYTDCKLLVSIQLIDKKHKYRILYGPLKRADFTLFTGLGIANIIRSTWKNLTGNDLPPFPYGWGHKEDGTEYTHNELYTDVNDED